MLFELVELAIDIGIGVWKSRINRVGSRGGGSSKVAIGEMKEHVVS